MTPRSFGLCIADSQRHKSEYMGHGVAEMRVGTGGGGDILNGNDISFDCVCVVR